MAFALPKIFSHKTKPRPKPAYSPHTQEQIAGAMIDLALVGPRWIGEQMGEDIDEAFEIGETRVSLIQLIRHPIKTVKKTIRKWTISSWKRNLEAQLTAEYVWKPRLGGILEIESKRREDLEEAMRQETDPARWRQMRDQLRQLPETYPESAEAILDWVSTPEGYRKDVAFEKLEELRSRGNIGDEVWQGIRRQYSWDEISRFRRRPGRYLWEKGFGKRGTKEARLYKYTPQKWLGEPLGKALAKTGLGKAVAGIREATKQVARKVVDTAKKVLGVAAKAVAKATEKTVVKVAGKATWVAISSAISGAIGAAGGPITAIIAFLTGPALTKLTEWALKLACYGCGCASVGFIILIAFIVVVVGAAFQPGEMGGGALPGEQLVRVEKTASPTHIDLGAAGDVDYTIEVINKTDKEITNGTLVDTHNPDDFLISVWAGGDWASGVGTWSDITIPPNGSFSVNPRGSIQNTSEEGVITNNVSFTGTMDGDAVSDSTMAFVVVGNPAGQYPSGWPTAEGCLTQGPEGSDSHTGDEAIDIAPIDPKDPKPADLNVFATHDGKAYVGSNARCGYYIRVVSPIGFNTFYCHLGEDIIVEDEEQVLPGQPLGSVHVGIAGDSSGTHLHYEFEGLRMEPPYIPQEVKRGCVGRGDCNLCYW